MIEGEITNTIANKEQGMSNFKVNGEAGIKNMVFFTEFLRKKRLENVFSSLNHIFSDGDCVKINQWKGNLTWMKG